MIEQNLINWSKNIYFSMVTDSRFNTDIKTEIEAIHKKVLDALKDNNKFKIFFSNFKYITFENGKIQQYRVYYLVNINKRNTKRNDLYFLVNKIKPVYYGNKWGD